MNNYRYLLYTLVAFIPFILASCFEEEANPDAENIQLNEDIIKQYITDNNIDAQLTASGLYYSITTSSPTGRQAVPGNRLILRVKGLLPSGTVFENTNELLNKSDTIPLLETAFLTPDGLPIPQGLIEGLQLMRAGEKAIFIMPFFLAYGSTTSPYPSQVPPYSVVIYEVDLESVQTEDEVIQAYIADNGLTATPTTVEFEEESFTFYTILDEVGTGRQAVEKDTVKTNYEGRFLNEEVFDSSVEGTTFNFVLNGEGDAVIRGWYEGFRLRRQGDKGTMIFPSGLTYGSDGTNGIPPYEPLLFEFDIEAIEAGVE